jgi:outer membrane protein assembly factor BamB
MLPSLSLICLSLPSSGNDSWPGWRGPAGSGVASGAPPIEWSASENVRWKTPIPGRGLSSPVICEGLVFVTTAVGTGNKKEVEPTEAGGGERGRGEGGEGRRGDGPPDGNGRGPGGFGRGAPLEEQDFLVLALDRKTGGVKWETKLGRHMPHQGTHRDGSYASPTPVTDGERLYVSFGSYGIHALTLDGKVAWSVDLGDMDINNAFGEGSSPILWGDLLILNWDHEGDSFLVALEKASGKERWRTPRPRGTNWSSPVLVKAGGAEQVLVAGPITVAYDPKSGKELWREGDAPEGRGGGAIATPVVLDGLVVWATGGRRGGEARAWVAEAPEKGASVEPLWKVTVDGPHVPSPLAFEGKVYMLKQDSGILSVLDPASGKVEYGPERLDGVADVYASLIAANGHLYVAGRDGTVEVLATKPELVTVAVNELGEGIDATPSIAGDELYLRGLEHLYCIAK